MDDNRLTTKDKWEALWAGARLPTVRRPAYDIQRQLETHLPASGALSLIEIGCAPGGWMAYFDRHFGYRVAGLEYAEAAAEATKLNMRLLGIDAEVWVQDFFTFDCEKNKYDTVLSCGFIEHFRDPSPVMDRIVALSRIYVVTIVPNCLGVNGFISKAIRPKVYAEHNPIDVPMLNLLHANHGVETLFCDYVGGLQLIAPGANNKFFNSHGYCAKAVNAPVRVFNFLATQLQRMSGYTPRSRWLSDSLLYIGMKKRR